MPELPEAETITRALNRKLKKRKIKKVEIFAPKLRTPLGPLCTAKLEGRTHELVLSQVPEVTRKIGCRHARDAERP